MVEVAETEHERNRRIIEDFRAHDGRVGGVFENQPILLLHHRGAKSGTEYVNPLGYETLEGGYAVFGSKGGADTHPAWYHNLLAEPRASVEVGTERHDVVARVATGEERERIWTGWKATHPVFAGYEQKTARVIPVVILERT